MIGDDPVMHVAGPVRLGIRGMGARLDEAAHEVGVVIVVLALQQGADPFQPHAGIDRLVRQVLLAAVGEALALHEDEVPDLDEPVSVLLGAAGWSAPDFRAVIVEDLGAGAAWAGRAHRPEIVVTGDADDPFLGQAGVFLPDRRRLVIGMEDGHQELIRVEAEFAGQQIPGIGDRRLLEVIPEAEISQHFEEGVVPGRIADIVEIVMLAAGADAFLARRRAPVIAVLDAGEKVLELHHPRIGEHQRRVIARNQRRAFHDLVVLTLEEVEEGGADLVQRRHAFDLRGLRQWRLGSFTPHRSASPPP